MGWFFCTRGCGYIRDRSKKIPSTTTFPASTDGDVRSHISSMIPGGWLGRDGVGNAPEEREETITVKEFRYGELAAATKNFKTDCLIGEGGFGRVYKGRIGLTDQLVAIKQLDQNGLQGNREFLAEVVMLTQVHHPNLVNLIGYCSDGDQRLLVYEFMPLGSLEDHLFDLGYSRNSLDWSVRIKIAAGAAKGLEFLHNKAKPPVIYRDMKCSNILLGEDFHPKLSDFGLAKHGPTGDKSHVSTRVMGTYGYCAPEYANTGKLTTKSDIYSFGVVLLEILTGMRSIDNSRPTFQRNLVTWARPYARDRKRFHQLVDPALNGNYPHKVVFQALSVASMCLQEQPTMRPPIQDVVTALTYLISSGTQSSSRTLPNENESGSSRSPAFTSESDQVEKEQYIIV